MSAIKGYCSLNQVFVLKKMGISSSQEISMLIKSFVKSCPQEARPPNWDMSLVIRSLMRHPYESLKKVLVRDLTLKTLFLLAVASAKRVDELHRLWLRCAV